MPLPVVTLPLPLPLSHDTWRRRVRGVGVTLRTGVGVTLRTGVEIVLVLEIDAWEGIEEATEGKEGREEEGGKEAETLIFSRVAGVWLECLLNSNCANWLLP